MTILTIRTDNPEAELGLYDELKKLNYLKWQAHRQLAETIHLKIEEILNRSSISLKEVQGIVCYKGPGSFTGLRIGLSVANALAYALDTPIVARGGKNWLKTGIQDLLDGNPPAGGDRIALPEYGHPANITPPKNKP